MPDVAALGSRLSSGRRPDLGRASGPFIDGTPHARGARKTIDDLLRLGEEARAELIHDKPEASGEHGIPQARIAEWTGRRFGRKPGGKWPGGWWIGSEIVVGYARDEVYRHDLAGYRRERAPECPRQRT